jgi:hypothetical protein
MSRLAREFRTMQRMIEIHCADKHGKPRGTLCDGCAEFLVYVERRLEKCPYGEDKPTCAKCPIHCYKPLQRDMAREVMRYAGPRMPWRHPWLSLLHVVDKLRRVEHPMDARRREREAAGSRGNVRATSENGDGTG